MGHVQCGSALLELLQFASGGPSNGWKVLGFSNIDWGQDLLFVDKWIKDHPECRPLAFELDYFGMNGELFEMEKRSPVSLKAKTLSKETLAAITTPKPTVPTPTVPTVEKHSQTLMLNQRKRSRTDLFTT